MQYRCLSLSVGFASSIGHFLAADVILLYPSSIYCLPLLVCWSTNFKASFARIDTRKKKLERKLCANLLMLTFNFPFLLPTFPFFPKKKQKALFVCLWNELQEGLGIYAVLDYCNRLPFTPTDYSRAQMINPNMPHFRHSLLSSG